MQRRTWLGLGIGGAALLALGGGGAALVLSSPAWRNGRLLEPGTRVLRAVARTVLDGSLPQAADAQRVALDAHLERMNATIGTMAPAAQREIDQLLTLLASAPGRVALAGLSAPWDDASIDAIGEALQTMRLSTLALRRQAYQALRDLTHGAYFADPSTWSLLGYPGPLKIS